MFAELCGTLLASAAGVEFVRRVQLRAGRIDQPRGQRWSLSATPSSGGLGFVPCFLFACVLLDESAELAPVMAGALAMMLLGAWDDRRPLRASTKLMVQLVTALAVTAGGVVLHVSGVPLLDQLLTAAGLVVVTNALNLSDNIDGLAAGLALIASFALAVLFFGTGRLAAAGACLVLAAALAGFWIRNLPTASIFMGDSGSLALGMALATLAVLAVEDASPVHATAVPLLLFLVPLADVALVMVTRYRAGKSVFEGGTDHASHRLARVGLSGWGVLSVAYITASAAALTAVTAMSESVEVVCLALMTAAAVVGVAMVGLATVDERKWDDNDGDELYPG